jgi:hypothetical protein
MRDGFKLVLLSLGYTLVLFGLPTLVVVIITLGAGASGSEALSGIATLFALLIQLVMAVLSLGYLVYVPSAIARMTLYQRLGAGFEFKENVALIKRNPANYFMGLLIVVVVHVVSQLGIVLCCVGVLATTFWSYCVSAWVMGEVVRRDPLIGQPVAMAPAPTPGL